MPYGVGGVPRMLKRSDWLGCSVPWIAVALCVSIQSAEAQTLYGKSDPRVAVPNGVTDVGVIIVRADADRDGISDRFEIQFSINPTGGSGLNPNDPTDAAGDFDGDGLTNLKEFSLGTNPLAADTDGDGVGDGIEVAFGTDPLDPTSFAGGTLTAIDAKPDSVSLTINTVLPAPVRQLRVSATFSNGSVVDVTFGVRGTSYLSSNAAVVEVDSNGLLVAKAAGSATLTVSNGARNDSVNVTVTTFSPIALAVLNTPGDAQEVAAIPGFAFVADGSAGLTIVDIRNPSIPAIVSTTLTCGEAKDLRLQGNLAIVANGSAGLCIMDVSTFTRVTMLGSVNTPGDAQDVAVLGNLAYVADGRSGIQVVDIADPANPTIVGSLLLGGEVRGVDVVDTTLLASVANSTLVKVSVGDPAHPALLESLDTSSNDGARDVVGSGFLAFMADDLDGVHVVDTRSPMTVVSTPDAGRFFLSRDVALAGDLLFTTDHVAVNNIIIFNVGNRFNPVVAGNINFAGLPGVSNDAQRGIEVIGPILLVAGSAGLQIGKVYDFSDNSIVPPVVTLLSPVDGSEVLKGEVITVAAAAVDDVGVQAVEFFVNGAVAATDSTPPYAFSQAVPSTPSQLRILARARDFGGNEATAQIVVHVIDDPLTTVQGVVVRNDGSRAAGARVGVFGFAAQTDSLGFFSLPSIPTNRGAITVTAALASGETGRSESTPPIRRGITDVGTISTRLSRAVVATSGGVLVLDLPTQSVAATIGGDAIDVAVTPDGSTLLFVQFSSELLRFADLTTSPTTVLPQTIDLFPLRPQEVEIACMPNGFALVSVDGNRVLSINVGARALASSLDFPSLTLQGQRVSAIAGLCGTSSVLVTVIHDSVKSLNVLKRLDLSPSGQLSDPGVETAIGAFVPVDVEVSPDGKTALISHFGFDTSDKITIFEITDQGALLRKGGISSLPNIARSAAFAPDGLRAYVVHSSGFGATEGMMSVLDVLGPGDVLDSTIRIPLGGAVGFGTGYDVVAITSDGRRVLASSSSAKVVIVDALTSTVSDTILLPFGGGFGIDVIR